MHDPVDIREARPDETDALLEMLLHMDAHVAGVPRDVLELTTAGADAIRGRLAALMADPDALLLVAEDQEKLVAMAELRVVTDDGTWATAERREQRIGYVDDVWVEPSHRRRGLTRAMLTRLLDFAATRGVSDLTLEYSTANAEADGTWRSLGFAPIGVRASAPVATVRARLEGDAT